MDLQLMEVSLPSRGQLYQERVKIRILSVKEVKYLEVLPTDPDNADEALSKLLSLVVSRIPLGQAAHMTLSHCSPFLG